MPKGYHVQPHFSVFVPVYFRLPQMFKNVQRSGAGQSTSRKQRGPLLEESDPYVTPFSEHPQVFLGKLADALQRDVEQVIKSCRFDKRDLAADIRTVDPAKQKGSCSVVLPVL